MNIAKGTFYMFIAGMISVASGYAITVFLARKLGPSDFGAYSIITSLLFVLSVVLMYGVQQTTAKFVSERPKEKEGVRNKVLALQIILALGLFLIYFLVSPLLSQLFQEARIENYVRFGALFIVFQSLFAVYMGYLNGLEKYKEQAFMTSLYAVLKALIVIALVYLGFSILGAITGLVASAAICLAISLVAFGISWSGTRIRTQQIINFGLPIILYNLVTITIMNLDLFMLKAANSGITGNTITGYYTAALTISRAPYYIVSALTVTIFPAVASLQYHKKKKVLAAKVKKALFYTTIILVLICSIIATGARSLTGLLFGNQYSSASIVLVILIVGGSFFSFFLVLTTVIAALGKPRHALFFSLLIAVADILLCAILIPKLGIYGAAISNIASMFIGFIASLWYITRELENLVDTRQIMIILGLGALIGLLNYFFGFGGYYFLVSLLIFLLIYTLALFFLKVIDKSDIELFTKAFGKLDR